MVRGSADRTAGTRERGLRLLDADRRQVRAMHPDEMVFLDPEREEPDRLELRVGFGPGAPGRGGGGGRHDRRAAEQAAGVCGLGIPGGLGRGSRGVLATSFPGSEAGTDHLRAGVGDVSGIGREPGVSGLARRGDPLRPPTAAIDRRWCRRRWISTGASPLSTGASISRPPLSTGARRYRPEPPPAGPRYRPDPPSVDPRYRPELRRYRPDPPPADSRYRPELRRYRPDPPSADLGYRPELRGSPARGRPPNRGLPVRKSRCLPTAVGDVLGVSVWRHQLLRTVSGLETESGNHLCAGECAPDLDGRGVRGLRPRCRPEVGVPSRTCHLGVGSVTTCAALSAAGAG